MENQRRLFTGKINHGSGLIAAFAGIVGAGIMIVGYLFNAVM